MSEQISTACQAQILVHADMIEHFGKVCSHDTGKTARILGDLEGICIRILHPSCISRRAQGLISLLPTGCYATDYQPGLLVNMLKWSVPGRQTFGSAGEQEHLGKTARFRVVV